MQILQASTFSDIYLYLPVDRYSKEKKTQKLTQGSPLCQVNPLCTGCHFAFIAEVQNGATNLNKNIITLVKIIQTPRITFKASQT